MKAQVKTDSNDKNWVPLEKLIPLDTPLSLFVEPISACNFACKFCPNSDSHLIRQSGRYLGSMDFSLYTKLIMDLKWFDKPLKTLRLYKDGEPFLNRDLSKMVRLAKDHNVAERVVTMTNGSMLTLDNMLELLDAGIDQICISVYGLSDKQFLEFAKVKLDFDAFVNNIEKLYSIKGSCQIHIKIAGNFFSDKDKKHFLRIFGELSDTIHIDNAVNGWPDYDISHLLTKNMVDKGRWGQQVVDGKKVCPNLFYQLAVNSDGTVSLCCADWAHKLIVGDIRKQSLKEIWNSDSLYHYRVAHLLGNRWKISTCETCSFPDNSSIVNIDPYAEEILNKVNQSA